MNILKISLVSLGTALQSPFVCNRRKSSAKFRHCRISIPCCSHSFRSREFCSRRSSSRPSRTIDTAIQTNTEATENTKQIKPIFATNSNILVTGFCELRTVILFVRVVICTVGTDRDNSVLVNVGTGAQVAVYTEGLDFAPPIELRPYPGGGNLLSNVGLAGGWSYQVLEQFFRDVGRSMFQHDPAPLYETLNQLAASVPAGADGLRCEPLFAGTRLDPTVRGSLTGLSPQNFTARHLARAVLDGMARSLRDGYSAIEQITGRSQTRLVAAGNGLRENPLLAGIVSQSFGLPMQFTSHREEAAYGAALIAAAGQ